MIRAPELLEARPENVVRHPAQLAAHDGGMPRRPRTYADRGRAEAFGLAADDYDRYRPRYPRPLITELIRLSHMRALDVGAGTGITSAPMIEAGADVRSGTRPAHGTGRRR